MSSETVLCRNRGKAYCWVLLLLLAQLQAADWQASGSFEAEMLAFVKDTIETAHESTALTPTKAVYISRTLNGEYDPYWNTVSGVITDSTKDCVLFGYAFRGHWIWINNYKGSSRFYVVWKDYNCFTPYDVAYDEPYGDTLLINKDGNLKDKIGAFGNADRDVWGTAFNGVEIIYNTPPSENQATVSAVMCDTTTSRIEISICHMEDGAVAWSRFTDNKEVVAFETRMGFTKSIPSGP